MSSASAADRVQCRAKSSRPGPISEKQLFQFSWFAMLSMTFSRSLFPRRRQPMNLSMRSKFFPLVALVAVAGAHAEDVDLGKAVGSLIAAEKAYAKLAGETGFREASISVFADDAVIFAPNAVNGKKFWREARKPCDGLTTNLRLDVAEWTARLSLPSQWRCEKRAAENVSSR